MFSKALRSVVSFRFRLAVSGIMALGLICAAPVVAQTAASGLAVGKAGPQNRLTQPIVEANRVVLGGTLHPLATKANDRGAVADGMALNRVQVVLKRSDAQEAALKQAIAAMHTKGSASYHKWLTPDQFGKQYGPTDADIAKVEGWLGSHGFSITKVNPGKQTIEISGTAGQFRDTFHAAIHAYQVKGATGAMETHYANASAPEIPAALAPVFGGFASLNNFRFKSQSKVLGTAQLDRVTHKTTPGWNYGNSSESYEVLAPADFAVQYDLNPLYAAGTKGTGQSIAIVNETNIDIALVNNYRSLFGLPANPPQVIIDGNDPGIDGTNSLYGQNGASGEAYLDVEVAGAVAPNAQINLVIADDTALTDGLTLAMERAVYSNVSPVLSLSFLGCEYNQGSYNYFVSGLWEQAAAQGITVVVAAGDNGSAGCDDFDTQEFAVRGQAVNGLASTPYDVAVGGTDFYYGGNAATIGTYWNLGNANETTPMLTLGKKAPEQPFNSSQFAVNVYPESNTGGTSIFAASGGASTCGLPTTDSNGNTTACAPYPKPTWQSGAGVPNDSVRDLPDVSLFGSLAYNGSYTPICANDGDCQVGASSVAITGVGGTSVSAPEFAGMMALVNQVYGRQGQANYVMYPLATQFPAAFNDIQNGTVTVPCATTNTTDANTGETFTPNDCQSVTTGDYTITDQVYGTTTEGEIGLTAGVPAYNAGANYDLASGLGSIDAYNMVTHWGSVTLGATTTTLTPSATTFAHGTAVTISGTVAGSSTTPPTGNVGLVTTSAEVNNQGEALFPLTAGAYTGSVDYLPGGTYNIYGNYPGDGSNAASQSAPVTVTVTPEASQTLLQVYSAPNSSSYLAPVTSGGMYTYGVPLILSAQPENSAGKVTTNPTGTVVFNDGGTAVNTAVINASGDAEYNATFAPGAHSITAAYSGDASYAASVSPAAAFTVTKATPVITAVDYDTDQNGEAIVASNGSFFTVLVENPAAFTGLPFAAPTGTVTLTGAPAGTTSSATLTPGFDPNNGYPAGVALFQVPAGAALANYTFSFAYAGDTNYNARTTAIPETLNSFTGGLVSTVTATASAAQTSPAAPVLVTATVTGTTGGAAPTGTVLLIANGNQQYAFDGATLPTASGNSVTVTIPVDSRILYQGTNQITVLYEGSQTYYPSSTTLTIANPLSDFSLVPESTIVSVPNLAPTPGVAQEVINLASYNTFAGAVTLTCASPSAGVTCSLNTGTVNLSSGGSGVATLTVNTTGVTAAGTYDVVVTGTDATGKYVHTIGLQVVTPLITVPSFSLTGTAVVLANAGDSGNSTITVTPADGFTGTVPLTCTVTPAGPNSPTCGTASATITSAAAVTAQLPISTTATTPSGSYSVVVTGTNGSIVASTTISVSVTPTAQTFTLSANPTTVAIASQGGSGSTTLTVTPGASGFSGTVAFSCTVASAPSGASEDPTCSAASVTLNGTAAVTTTLNFNTTAQTGKLEMPLGGAFPGWYSMGGGVAMAALLFFGIGAGRRRESLGKLRILSLALFFAMLAGAAMGCGSGGGGGGGGTGPTGGTTTGTYTFNVTGTSGTGSTAVTASTTVTVTVN